MTLNEFKAWLEGFEHSFGHGGAPTQEEWALIKEKIDSLRLWDMPPVSYPPPFQTCTSETTYGRFWNPNPQPSD